MNGNDDINSDNKPDGDDELNAENDSFNYIDIVYIKEIKDFFNNLIKNQDDAQFISYPEGVYLKLFQFFFEQKKAVNICFHQEIPIENNVVIVVFTRNKDPNVFNSLTLKFDISTNRFTTISACSFIQIIDEIQTNTLRDQELKRIQGYKMKTILEGRLFDNRILAICTDNR